MKFNKDILNIDAAKVADELAVAIKSQIRQKLRKAGAIVGISGGIDSSVVVALCVKALGKDRVMGVILPEKESSSSSESLAEKLARHLGIEYIVNHISPALEGFGCYRLRNEAIRRVFPEFTDDYKAKITIASNILEKDTLNYFKLTIESPDGKTQSKRMPPAEYMQIVAASNFKQRTRMALLYYHAERLNRAVVGTGNKDEHELGFFVKYGDGGTDLKPIAHLYKVQIFQLAEYLGIPDEIVRRIPTTDTYSAEVTQTDFFFGIDFKLLDPILYGLENDIPTDEVGAELGLTAEQVERVYKDILQKQRTTKYLRLPPLEIDQVE
jgi:NAD+ synthase